jgi:hypothetical protein
MPEIRVVRRRRVSIAAYRQRVVDQTLNRSQTAQRGFLSWFLWFPESRAQFFRRSRFRHLGQGFDQLVFGVVQVFQLIYIQCF